MLEEFLIKARALLLNILAEPDDFDAITAGGFVSLNALYLPLLIHMVLFLQQYTYISPHCLQRFFRNYI